MRGRICTPASTEKPPPCWQAKGATGRVYGMVYSGLDVGFAISPILFGVLMDCGWYGATLLGAAAVFQRLPIATTVAA